MVNVSGRIDVSRSTRLELGFTENMERPARDRGLRHTLRPRLEAMSTIPETRDVQAVLERLARAGRPLLRFEEMGFTPLGEGPPPSGEGIRTERVDGGTVLRTALVHEGKVLGSLWFKAASADAFPAGHEAIVEAFADLVALALASDRRSRREEERRQRTEARRGAPADAGPRPRRARGVPAGLGGGPGRPLPRLPGTRPARRREGPRPRLRHVGDEAGRGPSRVRDPRVATRRPRRRLPDLPSPRAASRDHARPFACAPPRGRRRPR